MRRKDNHKGSIFLQTEETIVRKRQILLKVEASYVQLYKNIRNYTLLMDPGSPIDLMLWMITKMNENNGISMNQTMIEEYNSTLLKPLARKTFFRKLEILIRHNVIIRLGRGEYKMNPAIVWQSDMGTRMEHIKLMEEGGIKLKPSEILIADNKQDAAQLPEGTKIEPGFEEQVFDFGEPMSQEEAEELLDQHNNEESTGEEPAANTGGEFNSGWNNTEVKYE